VVGHVVAVGIASVVTVLVNVVSEVLTDVMIVMVISKLEVTLVGVLGHALVLVVVRVMGVGVVSPVIGMVLDAVSVVVLVYVLGVVLTVVLVRVVVAKMLVTLSLHVVVLSVLLASEMTLILEMRDMIFQIPVALVKVSVGVMLVAVEKLPLSVEIHGVVVLEGSLLFINAHSEVGVVLAWHVVHGVISLPVALRTLLLLLLLRLLLGSLLGRLDRPGESGSRFGLGFCLLLLSVMHFLVEESGLGSKVLLSLSLGLGGLGMVIRVVVERVRLLLGVIVFSLVAEGSLLVTRHVRSIHLLVWSLFVLMREGASHLAVLSWVAVHLFVLLGVRISALPVHISVLLALLVVLLRVAIGRVGVLWHIVFTLHFAVVLLGTHVEMLLALLGLLTLGADVLSCRLSANGFELDWVVSVDSVELLGVVGLHLEDKVSLVNVGLRSAESSAVGVEGGVVALVPSVCVEGSEVVPPVEVEAIGLGVVGVGFDVVVKKVPGHVFSVQTLAPGVESRSPEVHHDRLCLVGKLDGGIVFGDSAHLLVVDGPGDVVGSPGHLVDVPLVLRVKRLLVVVGLSLCFAITVDHVHGEGVLLYRRYNLDIELVPAAWVEVGAVPVGEEG
jgi:hypothetical protein